MDCIIYVRWSSAEQGRGSSKERQLDVCRRHAAAKGWNVIDEQVDEGLSAFSGRNVAAGALGQFSAAVDAGAYPNGVILLTEKVDRLSREKPKVVFSWMLRMTELGVVVAIADGDRRYDADSLDMATIITLIVEANLAHTESQNKADRLAGSWKAKRRKVAAGELLVMTRRAPAWVTVEGSPPAFKLVEDRAAIVRRIYEETVAGFGKASIARRLNVEGVPTFGRASGWHSSYVQKILNTSTVLGEMQPGRKPRGAPRELVGDPIIGYYPAVVDADLHARARKAMASRSRRVGGRGRRLVNLFAGLGRCGECGAVMTFRGKGVAVRAGGEHVREDYLVCDSYQRGRGCQSGRHFNYAAWEEAILDAVLIRAMDDRHFASHQQLRELEVEQAERIRQRDAAIAKRQVAQEVMLETPDADLKERWRELVQEVEANDRALGELGGRITAARGSVSPDEHRRRIFELHAQMEDEDEEARFEARSRVMEAVHELVTSIRFNATPPVVEVTTTGGLGCEVEHTAGSGPSSEFLYRYDPGFFPPA